MARAGGDSPRSLPTRRAPRPRSASLSPRKAPSACGSTTPGGGSYVSSSVGGCRQVTTSRPGMVATAREGWPPVASTTSASTAMAASPGASWSASRAERLPASALDRAQFSYATDVLRTPGRGQLREKVVDVGDRHREPRPPDGLGPRAQFVESPGDQGDDVEVAVKRGEQMIERSGIP